MIITMLTAVAMAGGASTQQDFTWRGTVAAGKTVEVRGINGDVRARAASGAEVEVTATKRGRQASLDDVRIDVVEHANGVTICAVYPNRYDDRPNDCEPGGGHNSTRDNDVRVHFEVRVPHGVHFEGYTVNGDVTAEQLAGDVTAGTVNGEIEVATSGRAEGRTVNGSIRATIGTTRWENDLEFQTVNGSITVTLPTGAGADVRVETLNGGISTDFPLTVEGGMSSRRIRGSIGGGGGALRLSTVNGEVRLRRAS